MSMPRRFKRAPRTPLSLLVLALLIPVVPARLDAQELKWRTLRTEYLRLVYYDQEHEYVLRHLGRCFENTMGYYRDFFGYTPHEEVTILLQDFDDYGYAGTSTIPNNYITLGIEPFEYVYETCPTNERFNWVINHELIHVVASEKSAGVDNFYRKIFFGKVAPTAEDPLSILYSYMSNPRRYAPRWYHEGFAVFMETWLAGGIGRALGGYDEMVFRSMARDGAYFYDVVGLESEGTTSDFQIGQNSYLYGTRFMSYLAYKHGPEKVIEWANRREGTKGWFASQFRRTFGVSLDDEWENWIEWEREWQAQNLATIREYPITHERVLYKQGLGSASRGYYDEKRGKFYAAVNYPGEFAHVAAIDVATGELEKVCGVQTPALYYVTSLAYDGDKTLFYTSNNGKHWRDLNCVDVTTGESRMLIENYRTGDLAFNRADRSLWGVQHHNGRSTLVRIEPPYDDWGLIRDVLLIPFGKDLFDIDVSPDGRWLTGSLNEVTGGAVLVRFEVEKLLSGDGGYDVLWEFPKTAPANFVFSRDGRYLFGTAYQTGVSNVFRWDFAGEEMEAVTNCETGYFRPAPVNDDSLIVFSYTGHGLKPVMIPNETTDDVKAIRYLGNEVVVNHPVVEEWKLGSPMAVDLDSAITYYGEYGSFRNLEIASIYPITEAYKNHASFGLRFNFMDPVGLQGGDLRISATPSDLPDDEIIHASASWRTWPWTFAATYNKADFYDYFGPTKTSRKGYSASVSYKNYLIADKPRFMEYTLQVAHHGDLERVPDAQNIAATFDRFSTASASLDYQRLHRSIGSVDAEKGITWNLSTFGNLVNEEIYSRIEGAVDLGVRTPWTHSSLWLRNAAGYSFGDREDAFANFFFGGFGNNWVDHQEIKRYRNSESFPGVELDAVGGTNYAKTMLEWTLPALRFKRLGFPALYMTWARTAFFTSGLFTNVTSETTQRELLNVGGQIDLRLVMFWGLSSTLSFGYAGAFEEDRKPETEFMVSLRIL